MKCLQSKRSYFLHFILFLFSLLADVHELLVSLNGFSHRLSDCIIHGFATSHSAQVAAGDGKNHTDLFTWYKSLINVKVHFNESKHSACPVCRAKNTLTVSPVTVTISLFRGYIILECQGELLTIVSYHSSFIYSP